ncbi:MAG: HEAT repeat protein [Myxococcota bacterium]|jgi:HEAT repeat protein
MFFRLISTVFVLCSLPSVASAQLDLPPAPVTQPPSAADGVTSTVKKEVVEDPEQVLRFFAEPANKIEELFNAFEAEKKISTKVYAAYLEDLRGFGLSSRSTALRALFSSHAKSVELAAEIIEWVGSSADTEQLVNAASMAADMGAVAKCLDSAARLQHGQLPALAASLLDHPRRQVRTLVETRLGEALNEDYLPKLLQFISFGRDADLRLRATRLLSMYSDHSDARQALRKALNDESVSVALQAVSALIGKGTEVEVAAMRQEFALAANDTEASYLLFGLLEAQDGRTESVLSAELEPRMREMAQRNDIFISAIAAAGLAEQLFRSELRESLLSIEQQVVFNLVRAVGGVEFYPQYARFAKLAQGSLSRVTGESMAGQPASAWIKWYENQEGNVKLVRGRIDVDALDLPRLRVAITAADGKEQVLCGSSAPFVYGDRMLGSAGQAKLLALLDEHSILKASLRPGDFGLTTAPISAAIIVTIGEQRKVLRFRGSAGEPWLNGLLTDFSDIYSATGWQTLASPGAGGLAFILEHLSDFDNAILDATVKGELFLQLSAGRMASLDLASLNAWLIELKDLPQRQQFWTPLLSKELYQIALLNPDSLQLANACIELALTNAYGELFDVAMNAAVAQAATQRGKSCALVLNSYPLEHRHAALGDTREIVRLAAVYSLSSLGQPSIPALESALNDASLSIVHAALIALGDLHAVAALPTMNLFAAADYDDTTRSIALSAIAAVDDASSLPLLHEAARDFSTAVRVAAINAISNLSTPAADEMLSELFVEYAGGPLESSYQRALFMRGAAACRSAMRPYLLDADIVLATRAAISVGLAGEPAAAPALIGLLTDSPRSIEVLNALVSATGADFRNTPDPAGTYAAWWEANSQDLPRDWLRKALIDSGFELDEYFDDPSRCSPKLAVEQLMVGLASAPTRLRPLCAYFLFNITKVDAPVILNGTPSSELLRRARPWQDWLESAK